MGFFVMTNILDKITLNKLGAKLNYKILNQAIASISS